ncbi:hypothetical protein FOYG_12219, partial [Fusarium oxysporum NRRL 32931]
MIWRLDYRRWGLKQMSDPGLSQSTVNQHQVRSKRTSKSRSSMETRVRGFYFISESCVASIVSSQPLIQVFPCVSERVVNGFVDWLTAVIQSRGKNKKISYE